MYKTINNYQKYSKFLKSHKHWSCEKISKKLGYGKESVRLWNIKLNIDRPDNKRNKKYIFNEKFFEKINTEEKAYFLGLLLTDGYITKDRYDIVLGLASKDEDILLKFAGALEVKPVKITRILDKKVYPRSIFRIGSKKIHSDISKYLSSNKTFSVEMPKIDKQLMRHFMRGCWDGDGSIEKVKCDFITASDKFFTQVYSLLNNIAGRELQVWKTKQGYKVIRLTRVDRKVLDWMYKDSLVYLNRKIKNYKDFWELLPNIKARR